MDKNKIPFVEQNFNASPNLMKISAWMEKPRIRHHHFAFSAILFRQGGLWEPCESEKGKKQFYKELSLFENFFREFLEWE